MSVHHAYSNLAAWEIGYPRRDEQIPVLLQQRKESAQIATKPLPWWDRALRTAKPKPKVILA